VEEHHRIWTLQYLKYGGWLRTQIQAFGSRRTTKSLLLFEDMYG